MMKTMRKYNKWFLVIGGTLLMLSFLVMGPQSMSADPSKRVVATADGLKITALDEATAALELDALRQTAGPLVTSLGVSDSYHWMLLVNEAERAGLVGGAGEGERVQWLVDELMPVYARAQVRQEMINQMGEGIRGLLDQQPTFLDQQVQQRMQDKAFATQLSDAVTGLVQDQRMGRGESRLQPREFDLMLAKFRGVVRMMEAYQRSLRFSDVRAVSDIKQVIDSVVVDATVLPAELLMNEVPEPTEADLAALLEKHKDTIPGDASSEYGFGYRQPARLKLEWLQVDRNVIEAAVALDPVAVNKYYQQNRAKFAGEFAAVRPQVEAELRGLRLNEVAADIDRVMKSRLRSATRTLEADGLYKRLPADWAAKRPSMQMLAGEIVEGVKSSDGVTLPMPTIESRGAAWTRIDRLNQLPGIGNAELRSGTFSLSLDQVAQLLRELGGTGNLGFQLGVTIEQPLTNPQGDMFYVTFTEARGASPAESVDEVRTELVRDARLLAAYNKLVAESDVIQLTLATDGVEGVKGMFTREGKSPPRVIQRARVSRENASELVLNQPGVREALVERAALVGVTTPATDANVADRSLVLQSPASLSVVAAVIVGQQPLTQEALRTFSSGLSRALAVRELGQNAPQAMPFTFEALQKRHNFVHSASDKDADKPAADAATAPATTPAPASAPAPPVPPAK